MRTGSQRVIMISGVKTIFVSTRAFGANYRVYASF